MPRTLVSSVLSLSLAAASFGLVACSGASDSTSSNAGAESVSTSDADAPANFAKVRDGLYRGGHPSYDNLVYLKSLGVTTIVDLEIADYVEATPEEIKEELNDAALLGLTVVREPMSAFEPFVNQAQMNATLDALAASYVAPSGDDDDDADGGVAVDAGDAGADGSADAGVDAAIDAAVDAAIDGGATDAGDAGSDGGGDVDAGPAPSTGAIYVHCRHGQDRTGLVVGLERVFIEGWDPADAYAEMLSYGFHTYFLGLKEYFFTQTGYHGS
jgi:protein tyrosine/serine phosphatase